MTDPLGSEARALLDAARAGLSPSAAAVQRVHAKVSAAAGAAAGGAAVGMSLGTKLGLVGLAVVVAAGSGWYVARGRSVPPASATSTAPASAVGSLDQPTAIERPAQPRAAAASTTPSPIPTTTSIAAPAPRSAAPEAKHQVGSVGGSSTASAAPSHRVAIASPSPSSAAAAPITAHPADLAREVELVDLAMAALRRGDPAIALRAVQRHAAETAGHGQLAEDAAAIEVEALCQLHDPSAAARLDAFEARFPRSAQRSRAISCGSRSTTPAR